WDVNKDGNEATADEVRKQGGTAHAYLCDVSNTDDVKRVAERVRRDVGDVTILVNNAGILHGLDLLQLTDQQIRKTIEINTMAHFWTVREFLPKMLEFDHGHIVTVSSMSGFYGASYLVDYSTSKYAVRGFTEALAEEIRRLGKTQIKTTTVFPMFVDTGLVTGIDQRFEKQLTPQQVAKATVSGVLRNRLHVFVPRKCDFTARLKMFLPTKVINLLIDFGNSKIQLQEKKSK
ncbi:17-beta-hydroxysteroid dehydrogenase 13-like, partial [Lingula anatina]|uniref:Short-chain dehydrogenase/reductase 3 n=1 Tax=Lingula anatina TaxID=7574 RepID=A0A1S3JGD4_LINAN